MTRLTWAPLNKLKKTLSYRLVSKRNIHGIVSKIRLLLNHRCHESVLALAKNLGTLYSCAQALWRKRRRLNSSLSTWKSMAKLYSSWANEVRCRWIKIRITRMLIRQVRAIFALIDRKTMWRRCIVTKITRQTTPWRSSITQSKTLCH